MALLAAVVAAGTAKATTANPSVPPTGRQTFGDLGVNETNGSPSGNINAAATFTVGELVSTGNQLGVFVGMPRQFFNPFTFNITDPTSLAFGNGIFGHYASTSITEIEIRPTAVAFDVVGEWTPGSFFHGVGHGPFEAAYTISFTQTVSHGIISSSSSFATPTTVIPEPPSFVLVLTGLAAAVVIYGFRRSRRQLVMA